MSRTTPANRIPDIVRAAIAVFIRKGYRLARMEEIASEANVSKATLYYYFKSKVHLFQYALENSHLVEGGGRQESVIPSPADSQPRSEEDFLKLLKKKLRGDARLRQVDRFLDRRPDEVDAESELAHIIEELWDISERNRIQIIVLEKSFYEFPELAEIYDRYGRKNLLRQLERYLTTRIQAGAIRPVRSVSVTARCLAESLAWFGFKQPGGKGRPFSKEDALPDLITVFVRGLKDQ